MPDAVIFINETAQLGGGEINMLQIASGLAQRSIPVQVILPESGPLAVKLCEASLPVTIVRGCPNASISFYLLGRIKVPNPLAWLINLASGSYWALQLARVLRHSPPGVVHTNSMLAHLFGGLAGRLAGRRVVWHFQDLVLPDSGFGIYRTVLLKAAEVLPDCIICISDPVAQQFTKSDKAQAKITVLYNSIDTKKFSSLSGDMTNRDKGCLQIGTSARLTYWKGQSVAIETAYRLKQAGVCFQWLFAGDVSLGSASFRKELENKICDWGLSDCVRLLGWVDDIAAFYRSLDLLVHIPLEPEPFGLSIIEAMACGVPVLATPGGAADRFVPASGGWLVPPGDVSATADMITAAAMNRPDLAIRAHRAHVYAVNAFNLDHYLDQLALIYSRLEQPSAERHA